MRKDLMVLFLAVALVIGNYAYEKVKETIAQKEELSSLKRKILEAKAEIRKLSSLKEEKKKPFPPDVYYLLLSKEYSPICHFSAGKQRSDRGIPYLLLSARCSVPDWNGARELFRELKKEFPLSVYSYAYSPGKLSFKAKLYGSKK